MSTDTLERTGSSILESLSETRDAVSVSRAFGDPYEVDDVTIIPVASVGGGGGGGEGEGPADADGGKGFGTGFGVGARPVGVYEVHDGEVTWTPAIDVNRIVKGAQVLTGIIAVCVSLVALRRR